MEQWQRHQQIHLFTSGSQDLLQLRAQDLRTPDLQQPLAAYQRLFSVLNTVFCCLLYEGILSRKEHGPM